MKKRTFCYAVMTASAVLALGSSFSVFAADWKLTDGGWVYEENSGAYATDTWKSSGDKQYYLDKDGYMVTNTLLNINESYYYVNSSGAMVTNEWRFLQNPAWQGDELVDEGSWYYFGSNGRANVAKDGKANPVSVNGKDYVFDTYGRMLTGWISESAESVPEEEWYNGMYYGDGDGDGSIVTNAWVIMSVPDDDNEDESDPTYHFYFGSNGKKTVSADKTIGDKKYHFDDRGVSVYGWDNSDTDGWRYYGDAEDPYLHTGWFQATPDEEMHADGYNDGSVYWYYASSKGVITEGELKSIDGKTYGFKSNGELITGLKRITTSEDNKKEIVAVNGVDSIDDVRDITDPNVSVIYFASGDGAVKTGTQTVTIDGTKYTFSFSSSGSPKGAGITGISSGYLYQNGNRLAAEEGTKYQIVSFTVKGEEKQYVVNESGVVQKKKKNLKDSDGYYYCTNSDGTLLHGPLDDKCNGEGH